MFIHDGTVLMRAGYILHQLTSRDDSFAYGFLALIGLMVVGVMLEFLWDYIASKIKVKK
jgi:hypothetical protein